MKFDKEKASTAATIRIDGAVALAMAISTASKVVADTGKALSDAILARGGFA
jgi:phage terminase large subunit-like protein